jgi:BRCT domain type II-containing protein
MLPPRSRDHRMRVLENQARQAAEAVGPAGHGDDPQMRMPLIVEVKRTPTKERRRRSPAKPKAEQPGLEDI